MVFMEKFFENYSRYMDPLFDTIVIIFGMILFLVQFFIWIMIIIQDRKKNKLRKQEQNEDIKSIEESERHRLVWIKAAGIIRETIGILPFLGILGTVIGLLTTLSEFNVEMGVDITNVITNFAPALTSTITAIIATIINSLLFNFMLLPKIIEQDEELGWDIIIRKSLEIAGEKINIDHNIDKEGIEDKIKKESKYKKMTTENIFSKEEEKPNPEKNQDEIDKKNPNNEENND
jgi:hypothetical protein